MTEHFITLSTTEPNNYVGLLKMRQGDINTQTIQATITANGQLFKFDRLSVFFNAVLPNGNVIRDKVTGVDYVNSKLNYVVADSFLQEVAQVTAWFSFENGNKTIDSTKNFQYSVIGGWKECIPQGNYIYELSEIQREIEEIIGNKDFSTLISKIDYLKTDLESLQSVVNDKSKKLEDFESTNNSRLISVESELAETKLHKTNRINAVEYGFKNDGITNNDTIMATYITNDSDKPLYFKKGTYIFESGHDFPGDMMLILDSGSELKLNSPTEIECFFSLRYSGTAYSWGSFIKGKGTINGNFKTKRIIGVMYQRNFPIENCMLKNFNLYGIQTHYTSLATYGGAKVRMRNVEIINEQPIIGTFGIYDNGFDNEFDNVEIQNCEKGIYSISSQFNQVHAWIVDPILIPNSTFAETDGYNVAFSNCVSDTMRYGFKPRNEFYSISVTNFSVFDNSGVYTPELIKTYPHVVFRGTVNSNYKVSNAMIASIAQITEVDMPNSTFINVTARSGDLANLSSIPFVSQYLSNLGNLGNLVSKVKTTLNLSTNFNTIMKTGLYETDLWSGSGGSNNPRENAMGLTLVVALNNTDSSNNVLQIFYSAETSQLFMRLYMVRTWYAWKSITLA
ncbi:DUF2479 domain-containing protein [Lactococcus lactis]|uniref:BppU family phage baseplate upper protein n=1 Tax=Lactococcus lactis TaxID=1358 RepID=UPI00223A92DE|nr:BppU family phage baseplate upper protein [Lactococcus lactis]MCT0037293.1 DUF2479 domain-containing protein [Lactococcus lactis subsp. lactis]MCT3140664.1 DUF2479 domain-containing protein [Lactococcus lactis]